MSAWDLPKTVNIAGIERPIRWWYGAILDILAIYNDPDYEIDEQWLVALNIFYPKLEEIPAEHLEECCHKLKEFIDVGVEEETQTNKIKLMDWEQDATMIFPAINRVLGREVRGDDSLHWWTFVGAYMEIGESLFSSVLNIRNKKAKGRKLEKWEKDFVQDNKDLITLKRKKSEEELEQEERDRKALEALIG